jgi:hypothetical protein
MERENAQAREASISGARPVGAAPDKGEGRRGREGGRPGGKRGARKAESDYLKLRAAWPRPWCDDDGPEAWLIYDVAVREVSPTAILAGAEVWAADAPRPNFLPLLSKWLRTRGWERPSPWALVKAGTDKAARQGAARPGRKVSLAQSALKAEINVGGW